MSLVLVKPALHLRVGPENLSTAARFRPVLKRRQRLPGRWRPSWAGGACVGQWCRVRYVVPQAA